MKYKLRKISFKLIIVLYVISFITSLYSIYYYNVNAADGSLSGVLFIGDSRLGGATKSKLESEGAQVLACVGSSPRHWLNVTKTGAGAVTSGNESITVTLPQKDKVNAIAIQLGVNDTSSLDAYKTVVSNLKNLYPDATIYIMSIIYCSGSYAHLNSDVATYNNNLRNYCSGSVVYADCNDKICSSNSLNSSYTGDGLHLNSAGVDIFVENIKSNISGEGGGKSADQVTIEEARETVAKWALDFYEKYPEGSRLTYSYNYESDGYDRYAIMKMSDDTFYSVLSGSSKMYVDCVGWVTMAYQRALGINLNFGVRPQGDMVNDYCKQWFELVPIQYGSDLCLGDILICPSEGEYDGAYRHVVLYCGQDGDGVHVTEMCRKGLHNRGFVGDTRTGFYETYHCCRYQYAARLVSYNGAYYQGFSSDVLGGSYDSDFVDLDKLQKKLKLKGLPTTVTYAGAKKTPNIFDFIKGLLDFIVGLLFMGLKIVVMGFTELAENITSDLLHKVQDVKISS